jgi:hypothetical protein
MQFLQKRDNSENTSSTLYHKSTIDFKIVRKTKKKMTLKIPCNNMLLTAQQDKQESSKLSVKKRRRPKVTKLTKLKQLKNNS